MALSFADAVREVRAMVQDRSVPDQRYTDQDVTDALAAASRQLIRLRSDIMIGVLRDYSPPTDYGTLSTAPYPFPEATFEALVMHAVGWLESRDDPYSENSRALAFMSKAEKELRG
jgi:hypothetical protein